MREAAVLVILLLAPLAGASWMAAGGQEPDTPQDANNMFADPDRSPGPAHRVYFQAFQTLPETSLSPNVGALGSRLLPAPSVHHRAMLGVWKDCNADGYIGLAESALQDYPAVLLLDKSLCPASSDPGAANDGAYVNEMRWIGMVDPCEHADDAYRLAHCPGVDAFAKNERVLYANGTYVWGDTGAPGDIPRTECILAPLPSGSTSGSGALIGYADCQSRRGVARTVNDLDPDGALGLRFDDPQHPEDSDSALNVPFPATLFGSRDGPGILQDDTSEGSARVWDCARPRAIQVADPRGPQEIAIDDPTGGYLDAGTFPFVVVDTLTGVGFHSGVLRVPLTDETGAYAWTPWPAPALGDPTASSWVAAERAVDGPAGDCDDDTRSRLAPHYPGNAVENDATPILDARKDRPSLTLVFYDGHRGIHPSLDPTTGATTPSDGGTFWLDHGRGGDGPMWSALAAVDQDAQLVDREDLGFTGGRFFTYYATIGANALATGIALPPPGVRYYGTENCGSNDQGILRGWVCDAGSWWKDANGDDNAPRYAEGLRIGRVPGDPYHVRDVDCYDGSVLVDSGVHASLADLSADPSCPFTGTS